MSEEMTTEDARERRRAAKLFNERLKLLANAFNTMGIATLVTLSVAPFASGTEQTIGQSVVGLMALPMLHLTGQAVLRRWKSEE